MAAFNEALEQTNQQLAQLGQSYLEGDLARTEFRSKRRELICSVFGTSAPNVPAGHDADVIKEDETLPPLTAPSDEVEAATKDVDLSAVAESAAEPADSTEPQSASEDQGMSRSTVMLTALLVLLALVGVGGLLAFVLR